MSGHSKWASIKHKKAAVDAKRGKLFTKIIREITMAARLSGGNPDNNPRLRTAIDSAKEANMPQDNIKKAIQKGTGELPGAVYEDVIYEGYGPGGVAIIVEGTTDNKNRTVSEIRNIFSKRNGNLGDNGCVGWMFTAKGYISIEKNKTSEEKLLEIVLELGADDLRTEDDDVFEVFMKTEVFEKVKNGLKEKNVPMSAAEISLQPQTYIKLTGKDAENMLALMEDLEAHDDVKNVSSNFDISKEEMDKFEEGK